MTTGAQGTGRKLQRLIGIGLVSIAVLATALAWAGVSVRELVARFGR